MTEIKQEYMTVKQLAQDSTLCFTEPMLRYYVLHQHKNGLAKAIRRIGRKLLVRRDLFIEWIEEQGCVEKLNHQHVLE